MRPPGVRESQKGKVVSDERLESAVRSWAERSGCELCVLFGSRGDDGQTVKGDVDLALAFPELPAPERRLRIINELQQACDPARADLLFLHAGTDPVVRFEVFRTGRPLFEKRAGMFREGFVKALMLYEDALPFRRALRDRLREQAKRGQIVS